MLFPSFSKAGILGINGRNLDYIFRYNRRRNYPLVDDKFETKKLCIKAGIPVPELYGVIAFQQQAGDVSRVSGEHKKFVVKPAKGSGGGGIIIIRDKTQHGFRRSSGIVMNQTEMRYSINNILNGMYSMGGQSDKALIEYAVNFDPVFDQITYQGVPDIRIIVYRGVPMMGMLRLPTRASDGKANLHKGGIGVGVDMARGITLAGVQGNRFIERHPETDYSIIGRQIPAWEQLLTIAATFYDISNMGYVGVDLVLDRDKGPMLLEANARPGLSIQIANCCGIESRTRQIDARISELHTMEDRVQFAKDHFKVEGLMV